MSSQTSDGNARTSADRVHRGDHSTMSVNVRDGRSIPRAEVAVEGGRRHKHPSHIDDGRSVPRMDGAVEGGHSRECDEREFVEHVGVH